MHAAPAQDLRGHRLPAVAHARGMLAPEPSTACSTAHAACARCWPATARRRTSSSFGRVLRPLHGGACPMLAAHRRGERTSFAPRPARGTASARCRARAPARARGERAALEATDGSRPDARATRARRCRLQTGARCTRRDAERARSRRAHGRRHDSRGDGRRDDELDRSASTGIRAGRRAARSGSRGRRTRATA